MGVLTFLMIQAGKGTSPTYKVGEITLSYKQTPLALRGTEGKQ